MTGVENLTTLSSHPILNLGIGGKLPVIEGFSADEISRLEEAAAAHMAEVGAAMARGELSLLHQGQGQFVIIPSDERRVFKQEQGVRRAAFSDLSFNGPSFSGDAAVFFSGMGNGSFSSILSRSLGVKAVPVEWRQFQDGELSATSTENVRDREAVLIQSLCPPVNENLLQLCLAADALKRGAARRMTAVVPYLGYARQDHPSARSSMGSVLVAKLLHASGVDRVVTMDIHAEQELGFFPPGAIVNLSAVPILAQHIRETCDLNEVTIVSPDAGGVKRAEKFVKALGGVPMAIFHKDRSEPNKVAEMVLLGTVKNRTCIIVDDMVDTGSTLAKAAEKLLAAGASRVLACATHALLSDGAVERILQSPIERMIVTDTIPMRRAGYGRFTVISVAPLFGEAINRLLSGGSISELAAVNGK